MIVDCFLLNDFLIRIGTPGAASEICESFEPYTNSANGK